MATWTQVRAALRHRPAQTAVVLLLCLLASSVGTLALTLLVRSTQPWDAAYAQIAGPHAVFHFDASRVSAAQLAQTASLSGVTQANGPEESVQVPFEATGQKGVIDVIGRSSPDGTFDRLILAAGRWPERSGEIAVTQTRDSSVPITPRLGDTIHALNIPARPGFVVVGEVLDVVPHGVAVDFSAAVPAAWVVPGEIQALAGAGEARLAYVMSYRFTDARTDAQVARDRQLVEQALPAGSESAPPVDWLQARAGSIWLINLISGIILAFTFFALGGVAVIVASAVAGAVVANYREIGVLKALGFVPRQVTAIYLGQMAVPALVASLAGVALGSLASRPILSETAGGLGLPVPSVFDPVVDALIPLAVVALVALAALAPALRGAHTNAVSAMSIGTAPPAARRSRLSDALLAVRAPRALSLGAGDAFARPVRACLALIALAIAFATAVFAGGFQSSISAIVQDRAALGIAQDVEVHRYSGVSDAVLSRRLSTDPATGVVVANRAVLLRAQGVKNPVELVGMRGDATALGYRAVEGRWFAAPGEAVIGPAVEQAAHVKVGDTLNGSIVGAGPVSIRVVGIFNDFNVGGLGIRIGWQTLAAADPGLAPDDYLVKLRAGADPDRFARRVAAVAPDFLDARTTSVADIDAQAGAITGLVTGLTVALLLIAAAGLLNASMLTARERAREISILKALGMSPLQVAAMVVSATGVLCVVGVIVGLPLGSWLQNELWSGLVAGFGVDIAFPNTLSFGPLAATATAAVIVALIGASLPARWAVRTPVALVLRAE